MIDLAVSGTVIRAAEAADLDGWLELWAGYNAFYGREGVTALPPPVIEVTWHRILDPLAPVHALVAARQGRLAGLAHYVLHMNTITVGHTCYLQDLFTSEEARGAGVGRALIEGVIRAASRLGADGVYWHTHASNSAARRLYDALAQDTGFVVYRPAIPSGTSAEETAHEAQGNQPA